MSVLEETLAFQMRAVLRAEPDREYKFHPTRRWRFDFAFPNRKLAIEVEGGKWTRGRHQRPDGFELDCEKYNAAAVMGWRVLRFTADMIADGRAIDTIQEAMHGD